MIHEIVQFIEYLENSNSEIFSENITLKEGLYVFLEKETGELVIKDENILKIEKDTDKYTSLYSDFLERYSNSEMLNPMKSFNSGPKIFISVGTPFGISISGKGMKNGRKKLLDAVNAYFKAATKYIDEASQKHVNWYREMKSFAITKMFEFIESKEEYNKAKDAYMFYFFLKEPELKDFREIHEKYLSEKVFNKDKFNKKDKAENVFGISDNLSGFNEKKTFLIHQTAPLNINYRVTGIAAMKLHKFFRLQQKNKVLPNPLPLFVDRDELTKKAISIYKNDRKKGHKEIIEDFLDKGEILQNYYLFYFQNNLKSSRIVDLDFVPVFKYEIDDMQIKAVFNIKSKEKGSLLYDYKITNVFKFQQKIVSKIFNNSLVQFSQKNNSYSYKYFDDIDNNPKYITSNTYTQIMKYRKSFYDYIYKSKRQAITDTMFQDIMKNGVWDDIRHDKDFNKGYAIKEKLNIWFSLYTYFSPIKDIDMVNKTENLFKRIKIIAKNENERIRTDEEFAFASGQIIWKLLLQSKSSNPSHALLEPFLQKTEAKLFKLAIARTFEMYKHEFTFYPVKYEFDKIFSEIMGYESDEINLKNLLTLILAGYFSETIFKKDKTEN